MEHSRPTFLLERFDKIKYKLIHIKAIKSIKKQIEEFLKDDDKNIVGLNIEHRSAYNLYSI